MKTTPAQPFYIRREGFTLLEMIGVIAVMAILAATITPNALRMLDRAAVRAEVDTLHNLGEQTKLFLQAKGWAPGLNPTLPAPTWDQDLGTFADISSADIVTNKRQIARSYIYEPAVLPPKRALLLSSMRTGLALPVAANLNTTALFDNVWNTADGTVPLAGGSWAGWAAWRATLNGNAGDYLIIERINLASIYNTDLQSLTITLNNKGSTAVSYNLVLADGTSQAAVNIPAPVLPSTTTVVILSNRRPKERINLYRSAAGVNLDYSYVLTTTSSGKTFDFNTATNWTPQ
jgi:prepilin-type N-terminal cleavage/methylation domain-containing protein